MAEQIRTYTEPRQQVRVPGDSRDRVVDESAAKIITGGSSGEAICGIGAVVLGILALLGVLPFTLTSIAVIAAGAALAFEGGAIASRYREVVAATSDDRSDAIQFEGGMTVELLGGIAGIVLGILGLLGVLPTVLLPVAAIVFGATLLLGSGTTSRLNSLSVSSGGRSYHVQRAMRDAVLGAAGTQVLVGLGSAVLGILALIGIGAGVITLTAIAMIAVGASELFSGSAVTSRLAAVMRR
ncbi:MAG TPA: hypothetical protein VFG50_07035 [Rhodothermales bacterium]|nr:hypothetical protein [Rhodothermales bacterium]